MSPDVSVVLCTWNRAPLLREALECLLHQVRAPMYEVIVVDNGSTDATAPLIRKLKALHAHLGSVFEPRQGLSFARNSGVALAQGRILAFTDDDVRVPATWVHEIVEFFDRCPAASYGGGPVWPSWPGRIPIWLTAAHWAPLGIQHYGEAPFRVDSARPLCLIGGNLVSNAATFARVGEFNPAVQRVGNGSGSTEDQEWEARVWAAGGHGMYDPALGVSAVLTPERLCKAHHRAWHFGHGRHAARMRLAELERSRFRFFGLPSHLWRSTMLDGAAWLKAVVRGDRVASFEREVRLWFAAGFLRERWG